jgi:PAS domain S-box-containing protein
MRRRPEGEERVTETTAASPIAGAGTGADRQAIGAGAVIFEGSGEMPARCRAFDWSATPLGPVSGWSQSLRTTVGLVLASRNPMFLWWGPELVQVYNDAYRPSLGQGDRHPRALGARGREFWTDIWHAIGPQIEQVMTTGEATWHEDQYLPIERNGRLEDVWWTYSYSPVRDDDGRIAGTLVVCQETTSRILGELEREQAQKRHLESEARLRAIFDGTYEYIGLLAPDGTLLEANRASLEFAGNTREEVVGHPFWDSPWFAHTPGAPEMVREGVARAAAGEFVRLEASLIRPSGESSTFDISFHPVRDRSGEVVLIVPEGREVTERKRAEVALRDSEARYRMLFESLDEGFCVIEVLFDDDGTPVDYRFIEANPAFTHQTGLTDAIGRRMRDLVPGHEPHWFATYGHVATTGEPIRFDAAAGAMGRYYDVYAFRVGRPDERKVAVLFKDVSAKRAAALERERLVRELEVERSRLAYVFQQAPTFLAVVRGPEHVFELANEAYYQLVGRRPLVGKRVVDALPEVVEQGFATLLDGVLAKGTPFVGREVPILLSRSAALPPEERYVDFVYLPVVEADGTRSGVIAHGTDVTEQVRARKEVELLYSREQQARNTVEAALATADAANRAKGEFLAVMSHELRTPLNAIGGYADLMEMGIRGPVTTQQRDDLRRIQASQRHLLGLINEVLNYAKLETGTVHYDIVDVGLRESLTAAESLVAPQARAKGLSLVVADCPPALTARADPEKLRQILVNLLSNAVKFTNGGGRITISAAADGEHVTILVADTGIGIPADKLEAIFDPFVQVRSDLTRPHEGTGLGLAISRDLARGMRGDLTATSSPGSGSTFILRIPRA